MFDEKINEQRLTASLAARRDLARLISRASSDGSLNSIVDKRLARSISRAVDIFDDTYLMLTNDRLTSAIVLARSFFEQVAYSAHIVHIATDNKYDFDRQNSLLLELDGSSEQRRRLFAKEVDPNLLHTEAALVKYGTNMPLVETKQLIASLQRTLSESGDEEGKARLMYSGLSEWSHPTLFSVVHVYTKNVPPTLTSAGLLSTDEVRETYVIWSLSLMLFLHAMWTNRS